MIPRTWRAAAVVTLLIVLLAATAAERFAPVPDADIARGTEAAFLLGAHPRELTRQGPQRWSLAVARYRFVGLPCGPARVQVTFAAASGPVEVVVASVQLARLEAGQKEFVQELHVCDSNLDVELRTSGRVTGGRTLGVLLGRVRVEPRARALVTARGVLLFSLPAALLLAGAWGAGTHPFKGIVLVGIALVGQALALWPGGAFFSPYAWQLALGLMSMFIGAAAFARWAERHVPGAGHWALSALLVAVFVQGVAATSPLMVVSDAVFHANKLAAVRAGDWFPLSVTQHAQPFRFPYGVSFYALLVPLLGLVKDGVLLVRCGAALSGLVASAALFALLGRQPARAGLAVILLQLLPVGFDMYSYGNLSNVFAQSMGVVFLAWWLGRAPGGMGIGAALFAVAALGHFSELVVLAVLGVALVLVRRVPSAENRVRWWALALGLLAAAIYYGHFAPLVIQQLPRLSEGAGPSAHVSLASGLVEQARWLLVRWGLPALLLAIVGWPRPKRSQLDLDLTALWLGGLPLLLLAAGTPLEVRYLYALTPVVAVAGADGLRRLWSAGRLGRCVALLLALFQLLVFTQVLLEAVFQRYR